MLGLAKISLRTGRCLGLWRISWDFEAHRLLSFYHRHLNKVIRLAFHLISPCGINRPILSHFSATSHLGGTQLCTHYEHSILADDYFNRRMNRVQLRVDKLSKEKPSPKYLETFSCPCEAAAIEEAQWSWKVQVLCSDSGKRLMDANWALGETGKQKPTSWVSGAIWSQKISIDSRALEKPILRTGLKLNCVSAFRLRDE